jgi:nucleoid-associated protein YgaU
MPLEKAQILNQVTDEVVHVMFNPEEYTLSRDINYAQAAVPGLRSPLLQFVHGQLQTLEMELLVDTYEAHGEGERLVPAGSDVRAEVAKVTGLMAIHGETHAPPPLVFTWGTLSFTCVLARVSERYVMFLQDGTPVRARLQVTFHEFTNPERAAREENRQTATYSKVHVVSAGDTLSGVAGRYYENAQLWRPIAIANGLDDPREIRVGQALRIPFLPFTDPASGERVA